MADRPGGPGALSAPALVAVLAGFAIHALLLAGATAGLPAWLRVGLAVAVLLLLPGFALVTLGVGPGVGAWASPAWALGLGVAWNALLLAFPWTMGVSFLGLSGGALIGSAALWALAWRRTPPAREPAAPLPRIALLAIALAALLAAAHAARFGPPSGYSSDSPEHLATLRHMLETGETLPATAFLAPRERLGTDVRKGLWLPQVALIARLAATDPETTWRWLGAFLVPLVILSVAAFGALIRGPAGAAVSAWAMVLTAGGGMAQTPLRQMGVASHLGDQLVLMTLVAVLADLERPGRGPRIAAAAFAFAAVAASAGTAIELAAAPPALGIGLLLRDRRWGPQATRLFGTALAIAVAAAPYLVARALQMPPSRNLIHTEPQGLMYLTGHWVVLSPGLLWARMGIAWVLVPLAWPWLWGAARRNLAVLFVLASSVAVAAVAYDPVVVGWLHPRIGYLLWRVVWIVPFAPFLGWLLPGTVESLRLARSPAARVRAGAALALCAALLLPGAVEAVQVLARPQLVTDLDRLDDSRPFEDALGWMDRHLPRGTIVLTDPATAYILPTRAHLYVTQVPDQHSSPADSLALRRMLDARDALDPWGSFARTAGVVRRYDVGAIALNGRFRSTPRLDYWSPSREWFEQARARLDRHPEAFSRLWDRGDFVVYAVRRAALDTLSAPPPPRPFVEPYVPGTRGVPTGPEPGLPELVGFSLVPDRAAPGDSASVVTRWHARVPAPPGGYQVIVRLDREPPPRAPAMIGKPVRKLLEHLRHERYRLRTGHLLLEGRYPAELWRADEVVMDSLGLRFPADLAAGRYRVEVRLARWPHYPNLRLSDYFFDRDFLSGVPVGTLTRISSPGRGAPTSLDGRHSRVRH